MFGGRITLRAGLAVAIAALAPMILLAGPSIAAASPCLVPGVGKPLDQVWRPDMLAAIGYTSQRQGDIAFAVRTDARFYGYRPDHVEWSASVVKAMLMVAYLDQPSVANRNLNGYDRSLLDPMITLSDNNAASTVRDIVGNGALQALANQVGMTHFATAQIWGETQITARDQTKFFVHIENYIAPRHRAYAMDLLSSIVPAERWGIGEVAPKGWKLYFKGGWGYGTGLLDHQVALLVRGCARVAIAVLTMYDGTHAYGKDTLRGIFSRLLRKLPAGTQPQIPFPPRSASPWPSMRHDLHNTGRGTTTAAYQGDSPWSFTTGRGLFTTPVIGGDGAIYFGSADDNFYALNGDGTLRWKFTTGNIIDAAAALDRAQRTVTIGSADDYLYHLSTDPRAPARRRVSWRYHATLRPATSQLVDWWEDDIAYGPDGNLYTGNTGGVVYSFTPAGRLRWTFRAGNSVWTMPAFSAGGLAYFGSVDRSIYALTQAGRPAWTSPTLGFVVSSPAIGSDGTVYIGSFDSKLYALDPTTGVPKWTFGTNDHIYSSPALGHDSRGATNAIYVASTDGSVYALSPSGSVLWSYDTGEPIRSSPALGPAPRGERRDILYVGSSDGSLYALDADTGRRRWSFKTVSSDPILRDRHELNGSPALGRTGVYIGSEDGTLWYIPYDYCLHRPDTRCVTRAGEPYAANLTRVVPVTAGGTTKPSGSEGPVPTSAEITGRLIVRHGGKTVYAAMLPAPSADSLIQTQPRFSFSAALSGDGRYVFLTPRSFLAPNTRYRVKVSGRWGADGSRTANWTLPGTWKRFGSFSDTFSFRTAPAGGPLPLGVGPSGATAFELRRLAMPLPAFLPSVNQIGFDSYVLLVGALTIGRPDATGTGSILLWAAQARKRPDGSYQADPHGTLVFPLAGSYRGNTLLLTVNHAVLTFSFGPVPLQRLDMRFALDQSLQAAPGASIYAESDCASIPNYGKATFYTGICNADGKLAAAGTFITNSYPSSGPANHRPPGLSVKTLKLLAPTATTDGSLSATLALAHGARYPAGDHRISLLLVDGAGQPVGLDYTDQTTSNDSRGNAASVALRLPAGTNLPPHLRAYVVADVFPLYTRPVS